MKPPRSFLLLIMFLSLIHGYSQSGFWVQRSDYGGHAIGGVVTFSNDTVGYAITGTYRDDTTHQYVYPNQLWQYNPKSDRWVRLRDFPGASSAGGIAFAIGSKAYYGLAGSPIKMQDFWEYDFLTDTWSQKDSFGGGDRGGAIAFSVGGKGYAGLGLKDSPGFRKDMWEYDPGLGHWTQKADYPGVGTIVNTAFVIRDTAYVGMGQYLPASLQKDFWRYEASSDTWTRRADFPGVNSINAASFVKNGKAYLCTGADSGAVTHRDVWEYDPIADSWQLVDSFTGPSRSAGLGMTIGSRSFMGTGYTGPPGYHWLKDFWEFAPDTTHTGTIETQASSLSISPNPTSGILHLNNSVETISVTDMTGRPYEVPHTDREIDVSALAAGVYVLRMQSGEGGMVRRFVKE